MRSQVSILSFSGVCLGLLQTIVMVSQVGTSVSASTGLNSHDKFWSDAAPDGRIRRQAPAANTSLGAPVHRPTFYLNNASSPALLASLDLVRNLAPVDATFGIHQIALLNTPASIQDVESALQAAWWASNNAIGTLTSSSLSVRIIIFRDYGLFSNTGLPVIDVTYVVGLNGSNVPAGFDVSTVTVRIPDIGTLNTQLASKQLQQCDCDVVEGRLLHLTGINSIAPNITSYRNALRTAWIATTPELVCPSCVVDVQFARTVITVGASGVRLTTAPYVVLLNGRVDQSAVAAATLPVLVENSLVSQGLPVRVYRGMDTPTYAALGFVTYLNANIQFQDIVAVQRTVQSYLSRALPRPPLQVTIWNLEPFLNPQATVITQSSYFLTTANGLILDPRLFYAPPIIDVMANETDGNITTVTGGTLGIFPLYLTGHIEANQLRSIAEILKIAYAESNPGLNADDVDVAIVSLDDGITFLPNPRLPTDVTAVTELHVSAMVNGVDPDRLPQLSPFHQLLSDPASQDALNARLQSFNTAVCKDCQFRKLRSLNLLQVDPSTSSIPDAQAVLQKILSSWSLANPQSAAWVPLDISLVSRDDSLANENGTLVSQMTYSVGYPLPAFNWYIPRDPDNSTLEQQLSQIRAVPFFGTPLHPQQFVVGRKMTPQDQQIFASSAMQAWAQDKDDLRQCQQVSANCFVAVVDPENPATTLVNGSPQFLYKYFILVDDRVYVPSSPLSLPQQVRLRSALDSGTTNAGNGGGVGVVVVPVSGGATTAPVIVSTTAATTVALLPISSTSSSSSVAQLPTVVIGQNPTGNNFNLTDNINLAVGTQRQRNQVLEQLAQVWQTVLQPNVTDIHISSQKDVAGIPNPQTADGRPIRTVTYLLQGTSHGPVDMNAALQRYRQLLPASGINAILAANPDITTPTPSLLVPVTAATVSTTTATAGPVIIVPVVVVTASTTSRAVTTSTTTTTTSPGRSAPLLLAMPPVLVGPGPFTINDSIAVTADTRRARDRVLDDQIRPVWQNVLGNNVTSFQLGVIRDAAFTTPQTPDGSNIRLIQYQVQGVARNVFDSEAAKQQFRQQILAAAPVHNVWAVSAADGNMTVLSTEPAVAISAAIATTTTTTPTSVVIVPISNVTIVPAALPLSFVGSLQMKNYNPSDQEAIAQTLQQLWTQALDTNDSNVLVQYLPTSGNSSAIGADGSPQFDYRYALFVQPNITTPDVAWTKFLALLQQSDIMEYISQVPGQAPIVQQSLTTTSSTVAVIPVLSFTEKQDIAISDQSQIGNISDGLRILWANAGGVNTSQSEVRIIDQVPLDPPRSTAAGVPIQTLTYGVTLQNATDLDAVRARAEGLIPSSPVLQRYFILPELGNSSSTTTTQSSVILLIPVGSGSTTPAPVLLAQQPAVHFFDGHVMGSQEVAGITDNLRTLWAQAYGVPPQSVNLTVASVTPLNQGSTNQPISRIQYTVVVPGRTETPQVEQAFNELLPQSSLATLMTMNANGPTLKTAHSLRIAVPDVVAMDQLNNGIRNSWVTALGMQAQPQLVNITLTNLQPENVATQTGVPISTMSYDLQVPTNVPVGPEQEASFFQILSQSAAQQYVISKTTAAAANQPTANLAAAALVPFSIADSAAIIAGSAPQRDRILNQIGKTWENALAPTASNVKVSLTSDAPNTVPTTPEGLPVRSVSYVVTGQNAGPLDEYAAKERFRQLAKTSPINGIFQIPDQPEQATTMAPLTESPAEVVIIAVSTSTSLPAATNETGVIVPVVIPVVVEASTTTTTPIPLVSYIRFLHLKRPVGPLDEAALRQLIATSWAQQNNQSADGITVHLLSNEPVVGVDGVVGSNVTYEILGPAEMTQPTADTNAAVLTKNGWAVCENCFFTPIHSFYLASEGDNKIVDPLALRQAIQQAVVTANPELPASSIQTGFPQNNPPLLSNELSPTSQDLLSISYFALARSADETLHPVREPTVDQLQSQFAAPGQTVYPVDAPSLIRPARLVVQNAGSWSDGSAQPLDSTGTAAVQSAVDSAVLTVASNHSLNCNGAQLLKSRTLYGLLGRQYTQLLYKVNSPNDSCTQLPAEITDEIARNAQDELGRNVVTEVPLPVALVQSSEATNPDRIYYYDYPGKLNIFDLQARKTELAASWLQGNPNCVKTNCNYTTQVMAVQRRVAVADKSDITRVFYTVHSDSPYAVYPPQQADTVASRGIRRVVYLPGAQTNQQLQYLIGSGSGNTTTVTPVDNRVRRRRQLTQTAGVAPSVSNDNLRYCYNPHSQTYTQYQEDYIEVNGDATGTDAGANVNLNNNKTSASTWTPSNCKDCVCGIPVFLALLQGHVNVSNPEQMAQLKTELLQPWLNNYANVTQDLYQIAPSAWSSYIVADPDYKFHDASNNPLSLVRYGVQVRGSSPSDLQIPDLTQAQLTTAADSAYPVCTTCAPQTNQSLYLANAPADIGNASTTAALTSALTQLWRNKNPAVPDLQVAGVALNNQATYSLLDNTSHVGPLQRMDYVVGMTPETNWTSLERLQEPAAVDLNSALETVLNNPNITVYQQNAVQALPIRQNTWVEGRTATPRWLPAAIIIPLAGLIALTLILVCLITRASRLFRSKKTVVITDPAQIQTMSAESPFKEGNGKNNMAFDDYRNVGRQDISKV